MITAAAAGGGTVTDVDDLRGLDERRRLLLSLGMLCYPFLAAAGLTQYTRGAGLVAGYLLLAGISACYLGIVVASMRSAWRLHWWLLAVMTVSFQLRRGASARRVDGTLGHAIDHHQPEHRGYCTRTGPARSGRTLG